MQPSRSISLNATECSVISDLKKAVAFAVPGGLHRYGVIPQRIVYAFVSLYAFPPDMLIVYGFAPLSIPTGIRLRLEDPTSTNIKLTSAKFRSSNESVETHPSPPDSFPPPDQQQTRPVDMP